MTPPLTCELKVRSSDLDAYGHVNHAAFLEYYEQARVEYLEQRGLSFPGLWQAGIGFVIARAEVDYHQPIGLSERILIEGNIESVGRTSVTLRQSMYRLPGRERVSRARFVAVFLARETGRPTPVPEAFRRAFPVSP
ncbi:MAG: acyl-CoA thioesterase [Candidatus Zixiibacteriota bacterium]|nr:MAG: acyl-CoA thioesterase [candidate division Zixibacteria bacterium]